jgi:DNA-binding CsgD family transcriptional regulator
MPMLSSILSHADFRRGHWEDAHRHAVEAVRGSRLNGQDPALAWALSDRATVEAARGDEAAAVRDAEEGIRAAERAGARAARIDSEVVLASVAVAHGRAREAVERYEGALRPWLDAGYLDPSCVAAIAGWAEVLVGLDRLDEAAARLEAFESAAVRLDRPAARAAVLRVRGLLATAQGDEAAANDAFAGALVQHERVPEPFERARTLLAQGEAFRRFRRRGQARQVLAESVAILERLGARPWLERAAAELARTGHRAAGDTLTATERQVAELVAAGMTNREVSEQLFMSPHTVEAHLTRVYRSLGVRGRTELARALASGAGSDARGRGAGAQDGGLG